MPTRTIKKRGVIAKFDAALKELGDIRMDAAKIEYDNNLKAAKRTVKALSTWNKTNFLSLYNLTKTIRRDIYTLPKKKLSNKQRKHLNNLKNKREIKMSNTKKISHGI